MSHVTVLVEALAGHFKLLPDAASRVKVLKWRNPSRMVKAFLQNNLQGLLVSVRLMDSTALRFQNTPVGVPTPLCALEVYEVGLWMIDTPEYRDNVNTGFMDIMVEECRRFFYNNPAFGCEKSVKSYDQVVKQQEILCTQVLVTRLNQDLPDYTII
jgi:hypothetical protein